MNRVRCVPRPDWRTAVRDTGLTWGDDYWDESSCYEFTSRDIEILERATNDLQAMCLQAVDRVVESGDYGDFAVPDWAVPLIEASWAGDGHPSVYGRFDLAYDGVRPPKMLEYNADTPTSLLEAAATQWHWLEQSRPDLDQFNSIHDALVEQWAYLHEHLFPGPVHFASAGSAGGEDDMTVAYMREAAMQAGLDTVGLAVEDLGWHESHRRFVDTAGAPVRNLFKLYPWEWLVREQFAPHISESWSQMFWIEPAWKMLLSNKAILPHLWRMFPGHPNLLRAAFSERKADFPDGCVRKPKLSREGANVTVAAPGVGRLDGADAGYGEEGFVYQEYFGLPDYGGRFPVVGSWVIGGESCGIGIREGVTRITDNRSFFVPHVIRD